MTRGFGGRNAFCRIGFKFALADQPVEETAQRRQTQRQARRPQTFTATAHNKGPHGRGIAKRPAFQANLFRQLHDRIQLALIVQQRNRTELAFDAEIT
ncbi:hypothetical protein D3C80_1760200 [compost metagenome]